MTPYTRKTRRPRNKHPEADLQAKIARFLDEHLPDNVMWTASMTGLHLGKATAERMRAHGVRRGFPDLVFAIPGDGLRAIELKLNERESSLSDEQKAYRDILQPLGHWHRCTSLEQVIAALRLWGVRLNPSPIWRAEMMVEREG